MREPLAEAFLAPTEDPRQDAIATVIYRLEHLNRSLRRSAQADEAAGVQEVLRDALDLLRPLSEAEEASDLQGETQLAPWQITVLRVFIQRHLPERIKLEDLAAAAGLSACQFGRVFLKSFGTTPMRFLKLVRLERAKRLLGATRLPFDEVAKRCGFPGKGYFQRIFHEETGMTPRRWRVCERV